MRADGNAIAHGEEDPSIREEYEATLTANEARAWSPNPSVPAKAWGAR
jgi:hypothetical protein